jgi:hypothetical protein
MRGEVSERNMQDEYGTHDLGLAAYLIVRGHPLTGLGGVAGGRRTFFFPGGAEADAPGFYQKAQVPAREFFQAVKDLKALALS